MDDLLKTALMAKLLPALSNREFCDGSASAMFTTIEQAIDAVLVETGRVVVPIEPTIGKLISMAIRFDHAFCTNQQEISGLPISIGLSPEHRSVLLGTMRQLHEEAVAGGFYNPQRESKYATLCDGLGLDAEGQVKQRQSDDNSGE